MCLCLGLMSSRHPIVNSRETCVLSDLTEHLKKFLRMELLPHLPGVVIDVCSPCCGVPPPLMRDCSRFRRTKCVTFLWTSIPQSGAVFSDRERGLGFANLALFVVSGLHLATFHKRESPVPNPESEPFANKSIWEVFSRSRSASIRLHGLSNRALSRLLFCPDVHVSDPVTALPNIVPMSTGVTNMQPYSFQQRNAIPST